MRAVRHASVTSIPCRCIHQVSVVQPNLPLGPYRHFKGLNYQVIDLARHSESLEWFVVYRAEYGERGLWIRPLAMFQETVVHNGVIVPRFEFLGESNS
jgi:hypothetical protein